MPDRVSRRSLMQLAGAGALAPRVIAGGSSGWPRTEGPDTPKLCMILSPRDATEAAMRRMKQLGVDHVLGGGPAIPWTEEGLRVLMERCRGGGLTLANLMIGGFPNAIYGRPGRDEDIDKVCQSIRAAGKAGLPVIEYNFYAHRAVEGYFETPGRAGSGMLSFDYGRVRDLPALPEEGEHSLEEMWKNVTYFLKAVVPVAVESHVRLALHPNDPPAPISRRSGQIMGSVEGWKRLVEIVPSPANGITFDCGVTREMGHDPVETCRWFGKRDTINHVHFRNVIMKAPREQYTEVFPDEGEVNMFAVMKELVRQKYPRLIYPEHPRGLDADREQPKSGQYAAWTYNVAYARAMLQAALETR